MAILAEKYAVDYSWYVDTILNLIRIAGDYVSEEVWYRVIQIVINRDDVQGYAAKTVFEVNDTRCSNCHFLCTFRKCISHHHYDTSCNSLCLFVNFHRLCRLQLVMRTW